MHSSLKVSIKPLVLVNRDHSSGVMCACVCVCVCVCVHDLSYGVMCDTAILCGGEFMFCVCSFGKASHEILIKSVALNSNFKRAIKSN